MLPPNPLVIGVDRMTCKGSTHTALRISAPDQPERWRVSWLPERRLTRNQAITAMTLAAVHTPGGHPDHNPAAIAAVAAELGLTPAAVTAHLATTRRSR
jgi:hypothetical protein